MSDRYYRTSRWFKLRTAALKRDGYRCVVPGCGQRAVVVDHVIARKDGGADVLHNLRSLCRYHDNALKEGTDGKRRRGGIMPGCNVDGSPIDTSHWGVQSRRPRTL